MPWNWMCSQSSARETMGRSRSCAQVMTPVNPMPPMVAANQSGFSVGEHSRRVPSDRTSSKQGTWLPKEPAVSWFLPWMSLAMAPPRVTYFVPGVTGRKNPRGTAKSRICASEMPASAVSTPVSGLKSISRLIPVVCSKVPSFSRQTSP